ncbi:hypothetical protein QUB56_13820 [Microcoleus sp. AR_TQ3_B6]|uniref:hypothetical protein n=1 Tax=Microcoleus sp. AR_TQ3_B6 TaxID=3055284 RepID=UPI002FD7109D
MAESPRTTLLALLLALKQLETPLTADERAKLKTKGQQLAIDPDDWDYIQEGLMAIVEQNPSLDRLFQTAKMQLQAIDGNIPIELLPTRQEKEAELFVDDKREPVSFGYFEGEPDRESDEILTTAINVLTKEDSAKTAKKLSFLQRMQNYLQKSNS